MAETRRDNLIYAPVVQEAFEKPTWARAIEYELQLGRVVDLDAAETAENDPPVRKNQTVSRELSARTRPCRLNRAMNAIELTSRRFSSGEDAPR